MKKAFLFSCLLFLSFLCQAQNQVNWTYEFKKSESSDSGSLIIKAQMEGNWAIYSQHTEEGGPIPTIFDFHEKEGYKLIGEVKEISEPIKSFSEMFEIDVIKYKHEAIFEQKVQNVRKGAIIIGSVTFMTCNDEKCLPPKEIRFEVKT